MTGAPTRAASPRPPAPRGGKRGVAKAPDPQTSAPRYLHVTYCDDIRHELRGKVSLIGCYGPDLIADRLPAVLPRLCLRAEVVSPISRPFERLKLRVVLNGETLVEENIPQEGYVPKASHTPVAPSLQVALFMVALSPFSIKEPGVLRVEAQTEAEILQGPGLRLLARSEPDGAKTAATPLVGVEPQGKSPAPAKKRTGPRAGGLRKDG